MKINSKFVNENNNGLLGYSDENALVQLENDDDDIDDSFADSDGNTTLVPWTQIPPKWNYPNKKKRYKIESCQIADWPPSPYPPDVKRRTNRKAWRKDNPEEWKKYVKAYNLALSKAIYYLPYNAEKCEKVGGKRAKYYEIPIRRARVTEFKNDTLSYPEEFEEDGGEDQDDGEDERADDGTVDGNSTNDLNITGKINPV